MDTFSEIVAENVRRMRRSRKWTQLRLAEEAGLSVPGIQGIESAKGNPKQETINILAQVFGVSPAELITRPGSQSREASPREELLRLLNQLDERSIETILGAVKALIDDRKSAASGE